MATVNDAAKAWYVKNGTQAFMSSQFAPRALFNKLADNKGAWRRLFQPVMQHHVNGADDDGVLEQCVIACTKCTRVWCPSNPNSTFTIHTDQTKKSYCPGLLAEQKRKSAELTKKKVVEHDDDEEEEEDLVGVEREVRHSPRLSKQGSKVASTQVKSWWPSQAQTAEFIRRYAMFVYTSETPFNKMNNKHLKKACAVMGIELPSDKYYILNDDILADESMTDSRHLESHVLFYFSSVTH